MTNDSERLFEDLTPPPGGLRSLRARLDYERTRRQRYRVATAMGVTLIALFVGVFLVKPIPLQHAAQPPVNLISESVTDPGVISLGLAPLPSEPIIIQPSERHRVAVQRVPTDNDAVVFYLMGTAR